MVVQDALGEFEKKTSDLIAKSNLSPKRHIPWALRAFATLLILLFFLSISDEPRGGPVTETVGVIQSSAVGKSTGVIAIVRLEDNNLVKANVLSSRIVQQGEVARIRVYRSIVTRRRTYDIYETDQPASQYKAN